MLFRSVVESKFKPSVPVSPSATKVHGLTDEMLQNEPVFADFWRECVDPILNEHTVLVAYNAPFDKAKIETTLGAPIETEMTCLMELYSQENLMSGETNNPIFTHLHDAQPRVRAGVR